ncbi:hypothetical protein T439DRAFT_44468 [Meredithblackwellia eburnea MCA 4105]
MITLPPPPPPPKLTRAKKRRIAKPPIWCPDDPACERSEHFKGDRTKGLNQVPTGSFESWGKMAEHYEKHLRHPRSDLQSLPPKPEGLVRGRVPANAHNRKRFDCTLDKVEGEPGEICGRSFAKIRYLVYHQDKDHPFLGLLPSTTSEVLRYPSEWPSTQPTSTPSAGHLAPHEDLSYIDPRHLRNDFFGVHLPVEAGPSPAWEDYLRHPSLRLAHPLPTPSGPLSFFSPPPVVSPEAPTFTIPHHNLDSLVEDTGGRPWCPRKGCDRSRFFKGTRNLRKTAHPEGLFNYKWHLKRHVHTKHPELGALGYQLPEVTWETPIVGDEQDERNKYFPIPRRPSR